MAQVKRSSFGVINMVLAVIAIGGFMYWLSVVSTPTVVAVAEEGPEVPIVTLADFASAPAMYTGIEIELDGVEIVDNVGSHLVYFALPGGGTGAYLVRLDPALMARGTVVLPGDRVNLIGTVGVVTPEMFDAWTQEGIFVGVAAPQRDMVGRATDFFRARDALVQPSATPPAATTPPAAQ